MGDKKKKLLTVQQALSLIADNWGAEGGESPIKSKKTIYNKISAKKLTNHGSKAFALLDPDEVLSVCGRKGA